NSGASAMFDTEKRRMLAHTQVRERTSYQPSLRSPSRLARGTSSAHGSRSSASEALETANVAESIANAQPGPAPATIAPAIAGPAAQLTLRDRLMSAFACCSRAAETVCGTRPVEAGEKNASPAPKSANRTSRCQTRA